MKTFGWLGGAVKARWVDEEERKKSWREGDERQTKHR